MVSENIDYLQREGPTAPAKLPDDVSMADRMDGLQIFKLPGRSGTASARGGNLTNIAFLDAHDRETVVRTYLDANPTLLDQYAKRQLMILFRGAGRQWRTAATAVANDYYAENIGRDWESSREAGDTQSCPFCNDDVLLSRLPSHLTSDCPET